MDNPKIYHYFVKKWEKHQHYHTTDKNFSKNMNWYKFYFSSIVTDSDILELPPEMRCFLYEAIWGVGSQYKGRLPSPKTICKRIGWTMDKLPDVQKFLDNFVELDFIEEYNPNKDETLFEEISFEKLLQVKGVTKSKITKVEGLRSLDERRKAMKLIFKEYFAHIQDWREIDTDELLQQKFTAGIDRETGEILVDDAVDDSATESDTHYEYIPVNNNRDWHSHDWKYQNINTVVGVEKHCFQNNHNREECAQVLDWAVCHKKWDISDIQFRLHDS